MLAKCRRNLSNDVLISELKLPQFLEIEGEQFDFVAPKLQQDSGQCHVITENGLLCTINHGVQCDAPQKQEDFHVQLCTLDLLLEADTRRVVLASSGVRLGYLFPLAALGSGVGIESDWATRFAEVGCREFLSIENINQFSTLRNTAELRSRVFSIEEIFPDNSALLVLSVEGLEKALVPAENLELSLLEKGIKFCKSFSQRESQINIDIQAQNIGLRVPISVEDSDLDVFCDLLNRADDDANGVGGFLSYYQLFEHCIEQVFANEIARVPNLGLSSWEMRQKLAELASEQKRFAYLQQNYLASGAKREVFQTLRQQCIDFHKLFPERPKDEEPWYKHLYAVRNIVVHNQMKFHRAAGAMELKDINRALRAASIEALFSFQIPAN